jgi:hypothetical protein
MKSGLEYVRPKFPLCRDAPQILMFSAKSKIWFIHCIPQFLTKMLEIIAYGRQTIPPLFSVFLKAPFWGQKVGSKVNSRVPFWLN